MIFFNWPFKFLALLVSDNSPLPLTPDYGPVVRYADGVFDPHFHRFVTIMEGEYTYSMYQINSSDLLTVIELIKKE
jgi:hypothetical protein